MIGTKITFPRNTNGSCLKATRLSARTVGDKRKLADVNSMDLLRQLDHPIPPLPIESFSKEVCLVTVSGTDNVGDTLNDCLVEPLPFPL